MVSRVIPVDDFDLVIFGGTGDLARRKILPGLFRRFRSGQMPEKSRIIGAARSDMDRAAYQGDIKKALEEFVPKASRPAKEVTAFLDRLDYVTIDAMGKGGWNTLAKMLRKDVVRAFYFSVAPSLFVRND